MSPIENGVKPFSTRIYTGPEIRPTRDVAYDLAKQIADNAEGKLARPYGLVVDIFYSPKFYRFTRSFEPDSNPYVNHRSAVVTTGVEVFWCDQQRIKRLGIALVDGSLHQIHTFSNATLKLMLVSEPIKDPNNNIVQNPLSEDYPKPQYALDHVMNYVELSPDLSKPIVFNGRDLRIERIELNPFQIGNILRDFESRK